MGKVAYLAQAVGSAEAAAIMGIHYTQPRRMVEKGLLTAYQPPMSLYSADPSRCYAIYDGGQAEENYQRYDMGVRSGRLSSRTREWLHARPDVLRHLKGVKQPIKFSDAIGMAEAAQILQVHESFIPRMVAAGKIVGRRPWNPRGAGGKIYILSRESCQANVRATKALESAGKKPGRKRSRKVS